MAAVTPTATYTGVLGNKRVEVVTFGAVVDTNTHASSLNRIDAVIPVILGAASASNALTCSTFSGGTVTFGVAGTVSAAMVMIIGN